MRGSRGGASRPQRQARSGVTYKESDDDDDEFVPNARLASDVAGRRSSLRNSVIEVEELGIAKGKRTLTLKRARTVEPPVSVAKEDVDVYAIPEAAPMEEKAIPPPGHGLQFPQVYEAAERVLSSHRRQSSAFECLLEAVSGASGDAEEVAGSSGQLSSAPKTTESKVKQEEEMTSAAYGPELLAAYSAFERKLQSAKEVKEDREGTTAVGRLARSSDEEIGLANSTIVQVMKDTVVTERDKKVEEGEKASADEKKYSRRGEKDKPNSMSSVDEKIESKNDDEDKQAVVSSVDDKKGSEKGEEDKSYNVSSADEDGEDGEDADYSWNESSDASDTENKRSVREKSDKPAPAKKPSQELKTIAKKTNVPKSDLDTAGRVLVPSKPTTAPPLLPKKRPGLWAGNKPFVPPGPQNLQTPTASHRRVVGLSRRHRPPPLHPYLLGS